MSVLRKLMRKSGQLVCLLVVLSCLWPAYGKITKGPLLLRVQADKAAVVWESDRPGEGKIYYRVEGRSADCLVTRPEQIEYQIGADSNGTITKTVFVHKVWLDGLRAGAVYRYRVADDEVETANFSFRTIGPDAKAVRFAVYSDCQANPNIHRKLVEHIMGYKPDFVVVTGDLVTTSSNYPEWSERFFEPLRGFGESVPVYVAKGNHDISARGYFEKLVVPVGQGTSFGFDFGPVHFYCADHHDVEPNRVLNQISSDLKASGAEWKFVCYHMPSINFGGHWSGWGYPDAIPTLSKAGADFVVAGHSHLYERFRPIEPVTGSNGAYTTYMTVGPAGGIERRSEPSFYHAATKFGPNFCLFQIDGDRLQLRAVDVNGVVFDHLEITKSNGAPDSAYLATAVPYYAVFLHQNLLRTWPWPLTSLPRENTTFTVEYHITTPAVSLPAAMTFALRSESEAYCLPEPRTVELPAAGGETAVQMTVTARKNLDTAGLTNGQGVALQPALWLDCSYDVEGIKEMVSLPVVVRISEAKQRAGSEVSGQVSR